MAIRTKIVATIGPASGNADVLRELAEAGADVFRVNFSHGSGEQRQGFLDAVRQVEQQIGEPLAVMGDLCGPKIRVSTIAGGAVALQQGEQLTIQREMIEGDSCRISTTLPELVDEARSGEKILMDDGKLLLDVVEARPPEELVCRVLRGGMLSSGKGVNLPDTDLSLSALTEKDRRDAAWIARREFDYVALSFVRKAGDVEQLRSLLRDGGSEAKIIAKIEKPQALANIEEIVDAADGVMVARGDLGVEMDLPQVPVAQKRIARLAHREGKPCIIATQMLATMTHSATPTRAEVSDVANAVLDFADAVMLSGETAVGDYPRQAVEMMNDIVHAVEGYHDQNHDHIDDVASAFPTAASIARGVHAILEAQDVQAVGVYTVTGTTALALAKQRLGRCVLAITPSRETARRMAMYYGVEPVVCTDKPQHTRDVLAEVSRLALEKGMVVSGQQVLVVSGRPLGVPGSANTIVVHTVE